MASTNHAIISNDVENRLLASANNQIPIQQEVKTNPLGVNHDERWFMNVAHE
jgi:hypothetical protein